MRVLPVAKIAHLAERERHVIAELDASLADEARRDGRVVRRRMRERLGREQPARLERTLPRPLSSSSTAV